MTFSYFLLIFKHVVTYSSLFSEGLATLAPMSVNSCCSSTNPHFPIKWLYPYVGKGLLLIGNYGTSYLKISGCQRIKERKKTTRVF